MPLLVLLAATLRRAVPDYDPMTGLTMTVPAGTTVKELAEMLHLPLEDVKLIMVNGVASSWNTALQGNERVAFFPPVGGG
ncbi:MoaD/ThiS family protein [Desulfosoma caldarium]|uniref:ThiS family protein n=1 Tax=Desulfosoma caldarium TaxID=610254 RepID=A0A3N1VR26_9BACT|nr:MoaD/ThiS family protein [Desulfosoma caldarium]ROR03521.1 ThiS family protein [Desulfosoma caldarium]